MSKRMSMLTVLLLVTMISVIVPSASKAAASAPNLQIGVVSDTHISAVDHSQELNLRNALRDYARIAPNYDALAIVGDLTQRGFESEYSILNNILAQEVNASKEKILAMGNHEYFERRFNPKPGLTDEVLKQRFVSNAQKYGPANNVYYDRWINDYHFIVLGSEWADNRNWDIPNVSEQQYAWLETTIAENAQSNKPIFVFLHQPIDDTTYCSEEWGAKFKNNRLKDILRAHPETVLFSGHTHCAVEHPRTVYQDGFTMVSTGAIGNLGYFEGGIIPYQKSQGLLVNVYDDRMEILGREFNTNRTVSKFTLPLPYNPASKTNDTVPPVFKANSKVTAMKYNNNAVELVWEAATDNTQVDKYIFTSNGKQVGTYSVDFWNKNQPPMLKTFVKGLDFTKSNTIEITAVDAWRNKSNKITTTVKPSTYVGWKEFDSNWYYFNPQTNWHTIGWFTDKNKWYYFGNDGIMQTGWIKVNGKHYYMKPDGVMTTGWVKDKNEWYYMQPTGEMTTGWLQEKGKWYFLKANGAMAKGWITSGGKSYFMNNSGVMSTGWINDGGKWYYLDADGHIMTGWLKLSNKWYHLSASGLMSTGWVKDAGKWYYMGTSGAMATGWVKDKNEWYHLNASGVMTTGWLKENNKWYFLNPSGAMVTKWASINGQWYFMNASGVMMTGWVKDEGKWYFTKPNGAMATGWIQNNNQWYHLNGSGVMSTDWVKIDGKWYYLFSNGAMATGWLKVDNEWYYLNASGIMMTGWLKENNKWYFLLANGTMATGKIYVDNRFYYLNDSGQLIE